jgi:PKD repeat protein
MKKQEAPPLTGPSEYGTSVTVQVSPDVLTRDGASQATITITAHDAAGQPLRNLSVRLETVVNNQPITFGTLNPRTVVTGVDGRATATYTAPAPSGATSDQLVTIAATPVGTDSNNAVARTAVVRLVPQGVVNPPAGLAPAFTISPATPTEDAQVLFDASTSRANGIITAYTWDFGNHQTGSGVRATSSYGDPGSYFVTLTITDEFGRTASTTQTVTINPGTGPTAAFTFSPADPRTGQQVIFDAALSTVPSGRRIVGYNWNFGDGGFGTGPAPAHVYTLPRTYVVVLTVTDDTGRTASTSLEVTVVAGSN